MSTTTDRHASLVAATMKDLMFIRAAAPHLSLRFSRVPRLSRARRLVALAVLSVAGFVLPVAVSPTAVSAQQADSEARVITFPVHPDGAHLVHWSDTFGAARGGGRSHIGVDMLGERMIPLVAAADGEVTWLRHDNARGNNLEITDDDGWAYHYVHINNDTPGTDDGANLYEYAFAPGIELGSRVSAGQIVAFMGDSGNAEQTAPHLHFEIERPDGTAINPTPPVDAAFARLSDLPDLSPEDIGPYTSTDHLVEDLFLTLVGRPATGAEVESIIRAIANHGLAGALTAYVDSDSIAADVDRLYVAYFLRLPDYGGFNYWVDRMSGDLGLVGMADHFAGSPEFEARYGNLDFAQFLDQLYVDVLGRVPDQSGKDYWLGRLSDPSDDVTRGTIVAFFTDSPEMRGLAEHRSELVALTALFGDRMPTDNEIQQWSDRRQGLPLVAAIDAQFLS